MSHRVHGVGRAVAADPATFVASAIRCPAVAAFIARSRLEDWTYRHGTALFQKRNPRAWCWNTTSADMNDDSAIGLMSELLSLALLLSLPLLAAIVIVGLLISVLQVVT